MDFDYLFKCIIIGNSSVGKSSLLLRFSDDQFSENFLLTIGVDFKIKKFEVNGARIKLELWDTAGQERFKNITTSYYRGCHGIVIVYDITDRQSFQDVENWLIRKIVVLNILEVEKHAREETTKILVGNKSDMISKREVQFDEGKNLADSLNIVFLETSAKRRINGDEIFKTLVERISISGQRLIKRDIQKFESSIELQKQNDCC